MQFRRKLLHSARFRPRSPLPGVAARTRVLGRALVAGSSERGAVEPYWRAGAEREALEAAGWEFLAEHAGGNEGITGMRDSDDDDTGTGRPVPESDGP
jgi:hypothetical protein